MNMKELRVGNLVLVNGIVEEVETVGESGINYCGFYDGICSTYEAKDIQGIPLTEEWLLNFGFIDDDDDFLIDISEQEIIHINLHKKRFLIEGYNGIVKLKEVYFIHQLQNLYFSLMGEEIIIKNI
jgi:hypothetical protein